MFIKLTSVASLILSIMLISCSSSYEQPSNPGASLTNTKWVLKELNGQNVATPEGGKEAFLILTTELNKANGSGGCNNFFTTYSVMGKKMIFEKIASTEMYCENRMDTEAAFFTALSNTLTYRIKGNTLYLSDVNKVIAKLNAASVK
ncbi:MAG: META domain-containing protein [Ignavibacteria bacterium]|nr:META domain-containing protein [Ignavibacteria bacterium]